MKRTLLEVGVCQVYQEKTFGGEHIIIDLWRMDYGVCVNDSTSERLIGCFRRIEEGEKMGNRL